MQFKVNIFQEWKKWRWWFSVAKLSSPVYPLATKSEFFFNDAFNLMACLIGMVFAMPFGKSNLTLFSLLVNAKQIEPTRKKPQQQRNQINRLQLKIQTQSNWFFISIKVFRTTRWIC